MRLSKTLIVITTLIFSSSTYAGTCNEDEQVKALALNMYHEARGEGVDAMQMVGEVTLNRVNNEHFPNSICGVVYQAKRKSNGKKVIGKCQFSWYCDGKSDKPKETESWEKSLEIAEGLVKGDIEPIGIEATHYHADNVKPSWSKHYTLVGYYGGHLFYRMGDRL